MHHEVCPLPTPAAELQTAGSARPLDWSVRGCGPGTAQPVTEHTAAGKTQSGHRFLVNRNCNYTAKYASNPVIYVL